MGSLPASGGPIPKNLVGYAGPVETDAELLAAWRAGDPRAGSRLFDRHYDRLLRFFKNKVGDELYDLIQQTLLACLESHDRLRDDTRFSTFLLGIARNVLLQHYRTRARKHGKLDFGVSSVADLMLAGGTTILARRQRDRVLLDALRQLPIDDQIVVELYYWEELSAGQIAELHEVPEGTIRSRLRRARQQLERVMPRVARSLGVELDEDLDFEQWARQTRALLAEGQEPDG